MVIYRGSDGKPGYHQVDDIHDAVSFVEEMRNNEGVDHARIFRLEEVTFEFKPYYRVEIGNGSSIAETSDADTNDSGEDYEESSAVEIAESDEDSDSDDSDQSANGSSDDEVAEDSDATDDEDSSSGARRGLFGR